MDQPNTPLPPASLSSFLPGSSYPYPTPHQIINPTPIPQNHLKHPHRLGRLHSQTPLHYHQSSSSSSSLSSSQQAAQYKQFAQERSHQSIDGRQTRRTDVPVSLLSASEGHRGTTRCGVSTVPRSVLGQKAHVVGSNASLTGSRPARSYIRSWRREVGEAASGNAEEEVAVEVGTGARIAPVAPALEQRDSDFSTADQHVVKVGSVGEQEEHTRDVQQDVPLNTFERAVRKVSGKEDGRVDAVRQETIKQERVVEQNQTKQQSQEQKKALAEKMVDTVHDLICSTWPSACEFDSPRSGSASDSASSSGEGLADAAQNGLVPLRAFIREILRRTKSSCATLRCAEWYLLRVRNILSVAPENSSSASSSGDSESSEPDLKRLPASSPLLCPRRAFLSALIVAHKFLHDRVYSNRAWAKVSGLDVIEIGKGELALACLLDWKLWVGRQDQDPSSDPKKEQDETSWFTAVGQHVPIPSKRSLEDQPLDVSPAEVATQCSSTDSSPSHLAGSTISTMDSAPRLAGLHAGSAFSSTAGSFAFVSPAQWQSRGQQMGRARSVENSAMTHLSTSMPGLSLDGGSSDASGVSPLSCVATEKDGEIHVLVNGEEQFSVQITSSPESFVDQPRARWNPRKRGSPLEAEGHDLDMALSTARNHLETSHDAQTGKKRRVSISKSQTTQVCGVI